MQSDGYDIENILNIEAMGTAAVDKCLGVKQARKTGQVY